MIQKIFVVVTLLFYQLTIFAQPSNNSRILLRATTSVAGGEYFIDILSNDDSTKVIFKLKKGMKQSEFEADTNTIRIRQILKSVKNVVPYNDTIKIFSLKLDSIFIAYTNYDYDSLTISNSKYEYYDKLIQEVLNSPTEILENRNHVVLDGITMSFQLTKKDITRTIYARSPKLASNPVLYNLITETTDLYRRSKKNDFLNKNRTSGY